MFVGRVTGDQPRRSGKDLASFPRGVRSLGGSEQEGEHRRAPLAAARSTHRGLSVDWDMAWAGT